jgi:hypothetical protein
VAATLPGIYGIGRPKLFKRFDADQLWVALILGLAVLCLAVYRMRML